MSKQKEKTTKSGFWQSLKRVFSDERTGFAFGIVIVVFTIYVLLAMVSFFFTGSGDYSVIMSDNVLTEDITNWTGYGGAVIADCLMRRWFGVASFVLLWFLLVVGLRLMRVKVVALWKAFLGTAFLTIWLSLLLDVAFGKLCQNIYLVPGGAHGVWLDNLLNGAIGFTGTLLLLIGTGLLFAVFAFSSTIPWLRRCFARKKQSSAEPQPEVEASVIDEPSEADDLLQPESDDNLQDDLANIGVTIVNSDDEPELVTEHVPVESADVSADVSEQTTIETVDTNANDDTVE